MKFDEGDKVKWKGQTIRGVGFIREISFKTGKPCYLVEFPNNYYTKLWEQDLISVITIKNGDTVKIKPDCDLYGLGKDNPKEMYGEVYNRNSSSGQIWVKWTNGEKNVYKEKDLKVVFESTNMKLETPPAVPKKCCCEIRTVVNFGCKCEGGQAELAEERA